MVPAGVAGPGTATSECPAGSGKAPRSVVAALFPGCGPRPSKSTGLVVTHVMAVILGGITALVVGIWARVHFEQKMKLCNSALGRLGQVFSSHVAGNCSLAHTLASLSIVAIVVGGLAAAGGIVRLLLDLVDGS